MKVRLLLYVLQTSMTGLTKKTKGPFKEEKENEEKENEVDSNDNINKLNHLPKFQRGIEAREKWRKEIIEEELTIQKYNEKML